MFMHLFFFAKIYRAFQFLFIINLFPHHTNFYLIIIKPHREKILKQFWSFKAKTVII